MLKYIVGDIFNSPAEVLVNTVNTVGVMGKGIALEFKNRYPEMHKYYQEMCDKRQFNLGNLLYWKREEKKILLFPTKKHWRSPSKLEYIEKGLIKFVESYESLGIESIAFPRLGCGNGGLDWEDVKPLMEKYLKPLPIRIYVYLGPYKDSVPEHKIQHEMERWLRSNKESIGFSFIREELMDSFERNNKFLLESNELKHISWGHNGIKIVNGDEIFISNDLMCDFWDHIREVGVIEIEKLPSRFNEFSRILLDILNRLDYIQPILIIKNKAEDTIESKGYQFANR